MTNKRTTVTWDILSDVSDVIGGQHASGNPADVGLSDQLTAQVRRLMPLSIQTSEEADSVLGALEPAIAALLSACAALEQQYARLEEQAKRKTK